MIEEIEFDAGGRAHRGWLTRPATREGATAGILLFHGGSGPTDHERERAARYAALGFAVLVPDLFGEVFADRTRGMAVIGGLVADPELLRGRAAAALDRLAGEPDVDPDRIAAVGHCFGGLAALELARSGAAIRAAASLHGRIATSAPAAPGRVRARILACTGAEDPFCTAEQRVSFEAELTAAGVDWQHHIYAGARHGFSVPGTDPAKQPGCAYDDRADRRSWNAVLGLLAEVL